MVGYEGAEPHKPQLTARSVSGSTVDSGPGQHLLMLRVEQTWLKVQGGLAAVSETEGNLPPGSLQLSTARWGQVRNLRKPRKDHQRD